MFIDDNKEHTYGKGSAIFLHCFGDYPFTLGCISIAEENMVKVLRTVDANARICIYSAKGWSVMSKFLKRSLIGLITFFCLYFTPLCVCNAISPTDSSDFVVLTDIVPDAIMEIRYYTLYNFIGDKVRGYDE